MRYIVFGAGAIGGTIGGRLHQGGHEVVLVARGAHLEAIQTTGLRLRWPDADATLRLPAVSSPEAAGVRPGDVVVLAVKSQDTAAAAERLAAVCPPDTPVVCAQNGVENERVALRRFRHVYAMCVRMPVSHLVPGVIEGYGSRAGSLDLGRYPAGADDTAAAVARDLNAAGFVSRVRADIMRYKYGKLLVNLGNAIEALCGPEARHSALYTRARGEGLACYQAAGIAWAEDKPPAQPGGVPAGNRAPVGVPHGGSSTWQGLARGAQSVEADFLNGEIVLLGRRYGLPTPVNETLQREVGRLARSGRPPGSVPLEQLLAAIDAG